MCVSLGEDVLCRRGELMRTTSQWSGAAVCASKRWKGAPQGHSPRRLRPSLFIAHTPGQSFPLRLLTALKDATELVKSCEACQFHAKQVHQPAQGLQTIPLSWPFPVWGLDILGPFPRAVGGYRYLYVAIDKFTKWAEVEPVRDIPARSAVKFIKGLVCRFSVPNRIITDKRLAVHQQPIQVLLRQPGHKDLLRLRCSPTQQRSSQASKHRGPQDNEL